MSYPDEPGPVLYLDVRRMDWAPRTHGRYPAKEFTRRRRAYRCQCRHRKGRNR